MSLYIRLSCEVLTDAKILAAGPEASWVWVRGLLYAKQHLTEEFGFTPYTPGSMSKPGETPVSPRKAKVSAPSGNGGTPIAISYARYSSAQQGAGSSEARQVEQAREWAIKKGMVLVELTDRGRSAFHGAHRTAGAFGRLLADVRAGLIPKGSWLVIESMNRLSREPAWDVLGVLREIVQAGVRLVILYRGDLEVDEAMLRRDEGILDDLIDDIKLAHRESSQKSRMSRKNWSRKVAAIQRGEAVCPRPPSWIVVEGEKRKNGRVVSAGKFVLDKERAKIVRKMIAWKMEGVGHTGIAKRLNEAGVPPLQAIANGKPASGWSDSTTKFVLRHHALYGAYVFAHPVDGRVPDPVENYYPPLMTKGEWLLLQQEMAEAPKTRGGRRIRKVPNLFAGLLKCGKCNAPMHIVEKSTRGYYYRSYQCSHVRRGIGTCDHNRMWRLEFVEELVLWYLHDQLTPDDLREKKDEAGPDRKLLAEKRALLAEAEERISRARARLLDEADERRYKRLQDVLGPEEDRAEALRVEVGEIESRLAAQQVQAPPEEVLGELRKLIQGQGTDEMRERLQLAVARIVEELQLGPRPVPYFVAEDGCGYPIEAAHPTVPRYPHTVILLRNGGYKVANAPPRKGWKAG